MMELSRLKIQSHWALSEIREQITKWNFATFVVTKQDRFVHLNEHIIPIIHGFDLHLWGAEEKEVLQFIDRVRSIGFHVSNVFRSPHQK